MLANLAISRLKNSLSGDLYSADLMFAILLRAHQLIWLLNQLTDFYVMQTPTSYKLMKSLSSQ